jgi:uncharacterized membrane protein YsdA (DUF1294 family)
MPELLTNWWQQYPFTTQLIIGYLLIVNITTFILFCLDKSRAASIGDVRRIPEKTLWFFCLIGGSLGGLSAMKLVRHKTKKISFQAVLAVILMIQIGLIYLAIFGIEINELQ